MVTRSKKKKTLARLEEESKKEQEPTPLNVGYELMGLIQESRYEQLSQENYLMQYRLRKLGANPKKNPDIGVERQVYIE